MTPEEALKTLENLAKLFIQEGAYNYQHEAEGMAVIDVAVNIIKQNLKKVDGGKKMLNEEQVKELFDKIEDSPYNYIFINGYKAALRDVLEIRGPKAGPSNGTV